MSLPKSLLFLEVCLLANFCVSESMDLRHDTDLKRDELPKLLRKGKGVPDAIGCSTLRLLCSLSLEEQHCAPMSVWSQDTVLETRNMHQASKAFILDDSLSLKSIFCSEMLKLDNRTTARTRIFGKQDGSCCNKSSCQKVKISASLQGKVA